MSRIRIAVIGGGHLGSIHAGLLSKRDDVEFVAVAESHPETRDRLKERNFSVFSDYRQLEGKIDACVIAVPTSMHFEVACWFLRQKIHAFIEKPIAPRFVEAEKLVKLAQRFDCILQVGHVERFNPAYRAVSPKILSPIFIESYRCGSYTGRSTDIGVVFDLMIHDIDLVLDLVPSQVVHIGGTGTSYLGEHEDLASAHLTFENGCVAHLHSSRIAAKARREMVCHMEHAIAEIDFAAGRATWIEAAQDVQARHRLADQLPVAERLRVKDELFERWLIPQTLPVESRNAIQDEHDDFLHAIRAGSQPRVTGRHGLEAVEIAEAIVEAIRLRGRKGTQDRERQLMPRSDSPAPPPMRRAG